MVAAPSPNFKSLIRQTQRGDGAAYEQLYGAMGPRVLGYIARRVKAEDIEDIAADVWVKIAKKISSFSYTSETGFLAWVFQIAHTTIIDHYRRQKETAQLTDEVLDYATARAHTVPETPADLYQKKLEKERVHRVIKKLNPGAQDVIDLVYFQGLSHREAASVLGKTEGNVRIIKMRALLTLQKLWEETL